MALRTVSSAAMAAAILAACKPEPVPTYWGDVQPLMQGRCVSCHQEGGIGPFPLDNYGVVKEYAELSLSAMKSRAMPPWRATPGHIDYAQDPSLSQVQIELFEHWMNELMPEGDANNPGAPLKDLSLTLDNVNFALEIPEPYVPSTEADDDYRCFLVDWPESDLSYVTGFEVRPDNNSVVHHVAAFLVRPDTLVGPSVLDDFQAFDDEEPGQGYTCFGGPSGANEVQIPVQQIAQWVPGSGAVVFPAQSGIPVPAGSLVVLQLHYSTDSWDGAPDQTAIDFQIADTVAKKGAFAPYLNPSWPLGGMTIPDGKETTHKHEGDPVPFFELMISDMDLSGGFDIHAAMLHMHLTGQSGLVRVDRADGSSQTLLEVDPWDFDWQISYQLDQPVAFEPGDAMYLECRWDNQTGTDLDWGEGSNEEMCVGNLFITEP